MKETSSLEDWLIHAAASRQKVESIHFDCLGNFESRHLIGLDLVRNAHTMLISSLLLLRNLAHDHGVKHVMVFLAAGVSDDCLRWSPEMWQGLDSVEEPPSFYLLRDPQIFDDESEEYRRPIPMPVENQDSVRAIFRSFRNEEAIAHAWEFTSGIYLIASLD